MAPKINTPTFQWAGQHEQPDVPKAFKTLTDRERLLT
jgi:hypothetical protein